MAVEDGPETVSAQEHAIYAGFMAGVFAYALEAAEKYDPLRIFLSSKIDLLPFQLFDFSTLMDELNKQGNIRALIAYETGLGKTILAGMVLQEVIARISQSRPARVLVLTPPAVLAQFHDELRTKFGFTLDVFDALEGRFSDRMIASIDTLKRERWRGSLAYQTWDLILVDELHRVSPDNKRGDLMEMLSGKTKSLLALTATPHDGKSDRYEYRLQLIAPEPLIIRRTRREALDINNRPLFDQRVNEHTEEFDVSDAEKRFYDQAERYVRERFRGSSAGGLVAAVVGRAISSSIRAGVRMLERRWVKLLAPGPGASQEEIEAARERLGEGGELSESEIDALLSAPPVSPEERDAEIALLRPVLEAGRRLINDHPIDSKGQYFLENLEQWISDGRKCLVFTGFLETVEYLRELLEQKGYRLREITSKVPLDERKQAVRQFTSDAGVQILVGTDAMSESLNLQAASVEVNYEVPWSPVAYIQRVGRIWRLGQKNKSLDIHNFLPAFKVERRVLEVVLEKVRTINEEFGEIGLSVFSSEVGSVDQLVRRDYAGEDITPHVEAAFEKTKYVSRQVLEVLNTSMTLPRVVSVEELHNHAHISLEGTFTESHLRTMLEYLKKAGYASGHLPEDETETSTYSVNYDDGKYVSVMSTSLNDPGVRTAVWVAKSVLERNSDVQFAYHKAMTGTLALYCVKVDGIKVYEEPLLVTPDGVLTFEGITSLLPHFCGEVSAVSFISLDEYMERRKKEWLERQMRLWEVRHDNLIRQALLAGDNVQKKLKAESLDSHMKKRPTEARVERVCDVCTVEFLKTESEESWRTRQDVEMEAMRAASEYYKERGYEVSDVSRQNAGYDLLCKRRDEVLRVEVKGIEGASSPTLTENERRVAHKFREGFVLFVLETRDGKARRFVVQDPVVNLNLRAHESTTYSVTGFEEFEVEV